MSVNKQEIRPCLQLIYGQVHGPERGFKNVDPVNLRMVHHCHGPCNCLLLNYRAQFIAVFSSNLLAVVQQCMPEVCRQDDGSSKYRARKASPASLVAASLYYPLFKKTLQQCLRFQEYPIPTKQNNLKNAVSTRKRT